MVSLKEMVETSLMATMLLSSGTAIYGLATEKSGHAVAGTVGVAGSLMLWRESTRRDTLQALRDDRASATKIASQLQDDLMQQKDQTTRLTEVLNCFKDESGRLYDVTALLNAQCRLKDLLQTTQSASVEYQKVLERAANLQLAFEELQKSQTTLSEELGRVKAESTTEKTIWVRKFDEMIADYESQLESLNRQLSEQQRSLDRYQDSNAVILDLEKQKLGGEADNLKLKLIELNQFNDALHAHLETGKTVVKELEGEFQLLTGSAFEELEGLHKAQLSERDRYLLQLSGQLEKTLAPRTFPGDTEAVRRANKIIDEVLKLSEGAIKLHRNDIEPGEVSDTIYFEVEGSLTHTVVDTLNGYGNPLQDALGTCIKPVEFTTDRRLGFVISCKVIHSRKKAAPKSTVDKLWIPAEQFAAKVPKLLKKPMTRVMGSTGEGKGIFVNLLLAVQANQSEPSIVSLHDPMDESIQDYWNIPKTSKGKSATTKAVKSFVAEFDHRLENGIAHPATLDVFDEVDIVADGDSSINKSFLNCAKGMRHNGMKAYIVGQSPSVGKKGWEWADMDNFNAVYFGTSILTAITKTPALETRSAKLKADYDKLREFCQIQNEEMGLEGWNEYRFGLIVTSGQAIWFELPNADSIPCDWTKLVQELPDEDATQSTQEAQKTPSIGCPDCGSTKTKSKPSTKKLSGGTIRKYITCGDCNHKFSTDL